jgi:hypothetical protein
VTRVSRGLARACGRNGQAVAPSPAAEGVHLRRAARTGRPPPPAPPHCAARIAQPGTARLPRALHRALPPLSAPARDRHGSRPREPRAAERPGAMRSLSSAAPARQAACRRAAAPAPARPARAPTRRAAPPRATPGTGPTTDADVPEGHRGLHADLYGDDAAAAHAGGGPYRPVPGEDDGSGLVPVFSYVSARDGAKPPGVFAVYDANKHLQYVGYRCAAVAAAGWRGRAGAAGAGRPPGLGVRRLLSLMPRTPSPHPPPPTPHPQPQHRAVRQDAARAHRRGTRRVRARARGGRPGGGGGSPW